MGSGVHTGLWKPPTLLALNVVLDIHLLWLTQLCPESQAASSHLLQPFHFPSTCLPPCSDMVADAACGLACLLHAV